MDFNTILGLIRKNTDLVVSFDYNEAPIQVPLYVKMNIILGGITGFFCNKIKSKHDNNFIYVEDQNIFALLHELGHAVGYYTNRSFSMKEDVTDVERYKEEIVAQNISMIVHSYFGLSFDITRHNEYILRYQRQLELKEVKDYMPALNREAMIGANYIISHWLKETQVKAA